MTAAAERKELHVPSAQADPCRRRAVAVGLRAGAGGVRVLLAGHVLRVARAAAEPRDAARRRWRRSSDSACARCASSSAGTTWRPAPTASVSPSFDATDPASYHWSEYDPLIEEARARGWKILLTVTSPVPRWATGNPRGRSLLFRPNASQYRAFMTAVGRHYGAEVSLFSIWNEPNHHEFLEPQFNSQRHAGLAEHLPGPLHGRLRRPARRRLCLTRTC